MFFFLSGFRHLVDRWRIQAAVLIFRFHRKEGRARKGVRPFTFVGLAIERFE
jgi:hypothetical protein